MENPSDNARICSTLVLRWRGEELSTKLCSQVHNLGSMTMAMTTLGSSLSLRPETARRGEFSGCLGLMQRAIPSLIITLSEPRAMKTLRAGPWPRKCGALIT